MKRLIASFLAAVLLCTTSFTAAVFAADSDFQIDEDGTLTAYTGTGGDVVIPDGVTSIGERVFKDRTDLTSIIIPDGVTSIYAAAFFGCSSMTSITIPSSIVSIGRDAFYGCTNLSDVYISDLKAYMEIAFDNIASQPTFYASNLYLNGELLSGNVAIPDGTSKIPDYMFYNNKNITGIIMPNSVLSIGANAFYRCSNLESVTIPDSVTTIGDRAFCACKSLTDILIPNSVESIGGNAFSFTGISSVTIPGSVTTIGESPFLSCDYLTEIDVDITNTNYCSIDGNLYNKSKTDLIQYAPGKKDSSFAIPDGVTLIRRFAFFYRENLESVTIPSSVTVIDSLAFFFCSRLENATIPNGVTSIGDWAFAHCRSLTNITIPDSVITIELSAFAYCKALTTISFLGDAPAFGDDAIPDSSSLTAYYPMGKEASYADAMAKFPNVNWVWQCSEHSCGAWTITNKPTATEDGTAERICTNNSAHKDTATLPKLTDTSVWTQGAYVAPTCENDGSREYTSTYGKVTETISATGHSWGAWIITNKPTATEDGTAERICANNSAHKDTATLPKLTDTSVWTQGARIEPTCENTGSQEYTSIYGTVTETLSAKGHAWGAWNVTKKPTATETGTAERICGNDSSHKDTATLPKLTDATVWTQGAYVAPTCENDGSREYTSTYGTVTETLSATGHAWGAWNVTKKPTATETGTAERICGNDSTHKDIKELPALTDSTVWTKGARIEPTCENTGSQEYTSIYGTVTETLSATGHAWGAWNVTKKPTATETGTAERICGNDSTHKDIKELPALTDSTVWTKGARIEPTCENTGSQEYTSIYGTVTETLSAMGHSFTVLQHDETKHWYKCERCEARSNEENHKGGQATKKEKATCSVCNAQYGKLLPDYALPADLKTTYGKALSDITLPTGWKWSDPSIVPTVTNNGYEAYYAIENEADYDWTNENGYDAAAKQIKLTLTVTVEKANQKLSFEKSSINKYTTDSAFTNELTKTAVFGAVSFSSSDESVATIDNNGLITIKGTGTTDITALAAETDNYNAASATFTLNVTRRRSSSGGGGRRGGASITITPGGAKNDGNQPGTNDWENPFIDVHESDWFYDSVKYVYINKMMNGVTSDMFAPEGNITRAMLVTVLYRMEKEPQAQASPFSDIANGSYYEKAVAWANANGIVKGVSDAEFAPDESITREQMAAMIYRYAAYKKMDLSAGESTNILSYADYSDISDYAVSAMRYAAGSGIINGMTADTLSPKGISTRAQAAAVFMRVFNLFNK